MALCKGENDDLQGVPIVVGGNGCVLVDGFPCSVQAKALEAFHDCLGDEGVGVSADLDEIDESRRDTLHVPWSSP